MLLVAGNDDVRPAVQRALQNPIVVRILSDCVNQSRRPDHFRHPGEFPDHLHRSFFRISKLLDQLALKFIEDGLRNE